jgi:hypothetical protein
MSSWSESGLPFQEALSYLLTGNKQWATDKAIVQLATKDLFR